MSEDTAAQEESTLGVESLSIKSEPPKPAEIVKSEFYFYSILNF